MNILLYKWVVGNSFAFLLVFMIAQRGWIGMVLDNDASYLTWVMCVVFIVFWLVSSYYIVFFNREVVRFHSAHPEGIAAEYFEQLRTKSRNQSGGAVDQSLLAGALRARLLLSIHIIQYVANMLILLGLIGTVVGFVIAVSGLGETIAEGEDVERIKAMLGQIINGMGVALFTTLVGSILGGLWLQVHYQMLHNAVSSLAIQIVERADVVVIPSLAADERADATATANRSGAAGLPPHPEADPA